MTYQLSLSRSARRVIAEKMNDAAALAVLEFMTGALLENPRRVGKELHAPLDGRLSARRGDYRIIYSIDDITDTVTVFHVDHRRDVYRPG